MTRQEIETYAQEKDRTLTTKDFSHKPTTILIHGDAKLNLTSVLIEHKEDYRIVYTEHTGFFVFHKDNITIRDWENWKEGLYGKKVKKTKV